MSFAGRAIAVAAFALLAACAKTVQVQPTPPPPTVVPPPAPVLPPPPKTAREAGVALVPPAATIYDQWAQRALQAFRSRDFRLLWAGQTVSLIGDGAFLIALGWKTTQVTGRASSLAILLMLHGLALLTTLLLGGALADRY